MIEISKIKTYLGITDESQDGLLGEIESYVSGFVSGYCRRNFSESENVEYFGNANGAVFLKHFPVSAVLSVSVNNRAAGAPVWKVLEESEYRVFSEEGYIAGNFPNGAGSVKVVYTSGFETVPSDLELLTVELCAKEFRQRQSQGIGSESVGSVRIDWTSGLTEMQKAILNRHKKQKV